MDIELIEIRDFLAATPPFDQLPPEALDALPEALELRYVRRGTQVLSIGDRNDRLHIVRSGAIDVTDKDGVLLARAGEGDIFGERSVLRGGEVHTNTRSIEDTLLYELPDEQFKALLREHKRFAYYYEPTDNVRLHEAVQPQLEADDSGFNLMATNVGDLLSRPAVQIGAEDSIREAAQIMSSQRVSSLLVERAGGGLAGIVTDRDLRTRCVAAGRSPDEPVHTIMTADPMHISVSSYAYEALLMMARNNVHHLPVLENGQLAGMVTANDLMHRRSASVVYLVSDIHKQKDVAGLTDSARHLPLLLRSMVEADATAHSIGHMFSSAGEAINVRLLTLAEQQLGPPPVPYVWLAAGSQARHEQTARSDQDNCLLLSDDYDAEQHGEYFEALARFVCDGLNECGYVYCPGEVMASNSEWRQPLKTWRGYFNRWVKTPQPKALMLASVFFDMRPLYGDTALFDQLQAHVLEQASDNRVFLAHMASNALQHSPPLGFFRGFVLVKGGAHGATLDLKHRGVVPITDLARVYALASGISAVNTQERLIDASGKGELSVSGSADLRDALEFVSTVRLRHQARQIRAGEPPDNFMPPQDLSGFERSHLKSAFAIVSTLQQALELRFQVASLG